MVWTVLRLYEQVERRRQSRISLEITPVFGYDSTVAKAVSWPLVLDGRGLN